MKPHMEQNYSCEYGVAENSFSSFKDWCLQNCWIKLALDTRVGEKTWELSRAWGHPIWQWHAKSTQPSSQGGANGAGGSLEVVSDVYGRWAALETILGLWGSCLGSGCGVWLPVISVWHQFNTAWRMKFQGKNWKAVVFSFQQICLWEDKATSETAFPYMTGCVGWLRQSHLGSDTACLVFWLPLLQRTWRAQTLFRVWLSEPSAHNNRCKEDRVHTASFPFNQS